MVEKPFTLKEDPIYFYLPLLYLGIFYVTAIIMADIVTYKLINFSGLVASASLFVFPLTYAISDIVTEAYGRHVALRLIFVALGAEFFSDGGLALMSHLPSPSDIILTANSYKIILAELPRIFVSNVFALIIGAILNINLMNKLKNLYHGRFFIIRSIISTLSGEIAYVILVYLFTFVGKVPFNKILIMMSVSMSFKIIFALIIAYPSAVIAHNIVTRKST
jgi:uncharacterized integral membrane protein (TIGR00697 family)